MHSVGCLKPKIVLGKAILVYFFTAKSELRTIVHHSNIAVYNVLNVIDGVATHWAIPSNAVERGGGGGGGGGVTLSSYIQYIAVLRQ